MAIASVLLLIAAIGGSLMAVRIFRGGVPPWTLSLVHAGVAAAGLIVLILVVVRGLGTPLAGTALIVLLLAAAGGLALASFHLRKRAAPKAIVAAHALAAVTGVVVLVFALLG